MPPRCDDWATTNTPGEQPHLSPPISFDLFGLQAVLVSSLITVFALAPDPAFWCQVPAARLLSTHFLPLSSYCDLEALTSLAPATQSFGRDKLHPLGMSLPPLTDYC